MPPYTQPLPACLQVGCKLRVQGAVVRSDRPSEPLEGYRTAQLTLNYNSCSPATWDARLGLCAAQASFRPLHLLHPQGGAVTSTVVVVQRV